MPQQIFERAAQWRAANHGNPYPFAEFASLTNGSVRWPPGVLVDASVYPAGAAGGLYIAAVTVAADATEVVIGDADGTDVARGSFRPGSPDKTVRLRGPAGQDAGLLLVDPVQMASLAGWGQATHRFERTQTELCAAAAWPSHTQGVLGFVAGDAAVSGEVWLVGGRGVRLRSREARELDGEPVTAVRVDAIGDPLFLRASCDDLGAFTAPRFIRTLAFTDGNTTVECELEDGSAFIGVHNGAAADTVLRVRATAEGLRIEAVGQTLAVS